MQKTMGHVMSEIPDQPIPKKWPGSIGEVVGDSPYRDTPIEPWQVWEVWGLDPWEAHIIKRIQRWNRPGGKGLKDLLKARHELEYLISREEERLHDDR